MGETSVVEMSLGGNDVAPPFPFQLTPETDEEILIIRYGWIVSANPLGQMIFSPILGWIAAKTGSVRLIGIVTSAAYIAGNILYATLSAFPTGDSRFWLMLTSRFIVGASSGIDMDRVADP